MADFTVSPITMRGGRERNLWHIFANDSDIDTSFDVVSEDAAWAQTVSGYVEILSSDSDDKSLNVNVLGVDEDGNRQLSVVVTNAADGTTVVAGTQEYTYVENCWLDELAAGTITIRRIDNTVIQAISTGQLWAPTVHHYAAERASYITAWGCTNLEASQVMEMKIELQNAAGTVVDQIDYKNLGNLGTDGTDFVKDRGGAVRIPPAHKVVVSGKCDADNSDGSAFLTGYDRVS